jgi:hypothetical protein
MPGTWSYDPTQLIGTSPTNMLMQVRRLIGDTNQADQQLYDEEINFAISQRGDIYGGGADCCRYLAAKYSRDIDTVQGELHRLYSARQKAYSARATELNRIAGFSGRGAPYAGGISVTDKMQNENNSDRVAPQFNLGMHENWIPVGPVGNETQSGSNSQAFDGSDTW